MNSISLHTNLNDL